MPSKTIIASLAVLSISVGLSTSESANPEALFFIVFYDPSDTHSQDFLKNQLVPTYKKIGKDWMEFVLVPLGLSKVTWGKPGIAACTVECINPAKSCNLNKYTTCGLDSLRYLPDQTKYLDFATCVKSSDVFKLNSKCAVDAGLTGEHDPYHCATSPLGEFSLCIDSLLIPWNMKSVPLVSVDGNEPPKPDQAEIMKNLLKYVCDKLQHKPPGCKKSPFSTSTTSPPTHPTYPFPTEWTSTPEPEADSLAE